MNKVTFYPSFYGKKKEKRKFFITTNNLHNSRFPSLNLFTFTEEMALPLITKRQKNFKQENC